MAGPAALMRIDLLTIFPEMFSGPFDSSIIKRACDRGALEVACHDIRAFATDTHRKVDDVPYGGGPGMVMKPEPLVAAIEAITPLGASYRRVLLCAQGRTFSHRIAKEFAGVDHLLLVCGRYEGVDERVRDGWIDDEISIGDYILSGGECAAMVVVDTVTRLLPGVLGNAESLQEESFSRGLLEYPQYTRPEVFRDQIVPKVLTSGDHQAIAAWRREASLARTLQRRPDLLNSSSQMSWRDKKE